ncbi:MAG: peptidase T [Bacteroidaceae bacterium]|nr:peptidase T [Bacteroidaceae bacterium]
MKLIDRFLRYVSFDTQSSEESQTTPSTPKQMVFANYLKDELVGLGLDDVTLDENGYIMATLPANVETKVPTVGFIAHYDTSPDCSGANVKPRIVDNYEGTDIVLSAEDGIVTSVEAFPELLAHKGEDLIVTDGHTLLGADDKAGIAEIVEGMAYLMAHPEIKHGKIRVGFNPDEEIGLGAHKFDVKQFGCDFAYTMDGGEVGELEYENFNAASAKIVVKGLNVHPGYAKGKMVNSQYIAHEFMGMVPRSETPEQTEGYEGFYHLTGISGSVERTSLSYIIRDHDRDKFEARKRTMAAVADELNRKYGEGTVEAQISDQYYNMLEKVKPVEYIIDIAKNAMLASGVTPKVCAIRGGTDGAQLSFKGLPCPNIFAGGLNFHGRHEFVPVQSMEKAMMTVVNISALVAKL